MVPELICDDERDTRRLMREPMEGAHAKAPGGLVSVDRAHGVS